MALQKSYSLPSGLEATGAYHKIDSLVVSVNSLTANVRVFANAVARDNDNPSIANLSFMLPYSESVSLSYAYQQLKLLNEYAGALDC